VIGIFFTLASAAYWIFERDRAVELVTSMLPRKRRRIVRDTWDLIDLKLGAYVRGQGLLILLVATLLSAAFAAIGLPLWLLIGPFAGIVEIVPVIGPITAGAVAIAAGLTESWQLGLYAGIAVLAVRLAEDYVVIRRGGRDPLRRLRRSARRSAGCRAGDPLPGDHAQPEPGGRGGSDRPLSGQGRRDDGIALSATRGASGRTPGRRA
jgi:AI-2E family transporter